MKKDTLIIILVGLITLSVGIIIGLNISMRNSKINDNDSQINNSIKGEIKENQDSEDNKPVIQNNESNTSNEPVVNNQVENQFIESQPEIIASQHEENKVSEPKQEVQTLYSASDTKVIESLESAYENIKNSEVTESFKINAKATFINIVDFLFYDGTIKGVTFDELTDNGKTKVLELANKIDETIESKVPNYKDSIVAGASKAYKSASNLIKKGVGNLNGFLQSKLSEDEYNSIINSKDDLVYYTKNAVSFLKDTGSKLFSISKEKLSDWYNKYKNR